MPAPGTEVRFHPVVEADCPCGCKVRVGYSDGQPTVLHPWPMCEHFIKYESPVDYVHFLQQEAIRQAKEHVKRASARYRIAKT